jgi:hypothetical protein
MSYKALITSLQMTEILIWDTLNAVNLLHNAETFIGTRSPSIG